VVGIDRSQKTGELHRMTGQAFVKDFNQADQKRRESKCLQSHLPPDPKVKLGTGREVLENQVNTVQCLGCT
jgi:hypothetical protein